MNVTTAGFRCGDRGRAFYLPIMFITFGFSVASAQCSQATRPEKASSSQPSTFAQSSPSTAASGESSSETLNGVRFATGSAVTVLENTPLQVITDAPISSRTTKAGAKFPFTVTRDVIVDSVLVIPCGTRVYGTVISAKQASRLAGASSLTLELTELELDGRTYPLYTPPFKVIGQSKTRPTVSKMITGAAVGTVAAEATVPKVTYTLVDPTGPSKTVTENLPTGQRARGVTVIAGLGAGVGAGIAAASPPSIAVIPAESQMEFRLASPIAVFPVDQRTAARLAQGLHRSGPALYVRGEMQ